MSDTADMVHEESLGSCFFIQPTSVELVTTTGQRPSTDKSRGQEDEGGSGQVHCHHSRLHH